MSWRMRLTYSVNNFVGKPPAGKVAATSKYRLVAKLPAIKCYW